MVLVIDDEIDLGDQVIEQALDQIQLKSVSRHDMRMPAQAGEEQVRKLGEFARRLAVHNDMKVRIRGHGHIDAAHPTVSSGQRPKARLCL